MGTAQIVVIVLLSARVAVHAAKDREPLPMPNVYHFGRACISAAVWVSLLWWGGFWSAA